MEIALHVIIYACLVIFLAAVAVRFIRITRYPLNVRWEIYPVPHEGPRSEHGGSRMEDVDWWKEERRPNKWYELKFMIPEMIFLKALYEHNRRLWYRSFPFHFGLYLFAGFGVLMAASAVLEVLGFPVGLSVGGAGKGMAYLTAGVGAAGMVLGLLGAAGLLHMRITDSELKPYSTFSHVFNLLFTIAGLGLTLAAWVHAGFDFAWLQGYAGSLITLDLSVSAGPPLASAAILAVALLLAYIPLTHMSHFFVKWFTWHKIRWDDEPNVKGGRIDRMVQKALQYPVSWSAKHINADARKTWADLATEEMEHDQ